MYNIFLISQFRRIPNADDKKGECVSSQTGSPLEPAYQFHIHGVIGIVLRHSHCSVLGITSLLVYFKSLHLSGLLVKNSMSKVKPTTGRSLTQSRKIERDTTCNKLLILRVHTRRSDITYTATNRSVETQHCIGLIETPVPSLHHTWSLGRAAKSCFNRKICGITGLTIQRVAVHCVLYARKSKANTQAAIPGVDLYAWRLTLFARVQYGGGKLGAY